MKPSQLLQHNAVVDENRFVLLDKKCLKHILFNLLSNATKYSGDGATIHCNTELSDALLKITIRDEGIGIPMEDQKYLFTRFFRAHNVENIKGTGLGLHIVRRYIELLKGNIRFESTEGKGTTFFIEIPLEEVKGEK